MNALVLIEEIAVTADSRFNKIESHDAVDILWNVADHDEEDDVLARMRDMLERNGFIVFRTSDELRAVALKETDLVEPE